MPTTRAPASRGLFATAFGATVGALIGGMLGYGAAWAFRIPQCVDAGHGCGILSDAYEFATAILVGGYAGVVIGAATVLRIGRHGHVGPTAAMLAVFVGLGAVAWVAMFLSTGSPVALLGPPLLLPFVAAWVRAVAVPRDASGARS